MNPPLHYTKPPRLEPLFLQKLLQAIHIQMEMSLRRLEQKPEIPGFCCWVEIHQSQWSVRVIWCFKTKHVLCGILLRADWIKVEIQQEFQPLWIYTNQHVMSNQPSDCNERVLLMRLAQSFKQSFLRFLNIFGFLVFAHHPHRDVAQQGDGIATWKSRSTLINQSCHQWVVLGSSLKWSCQWLVLPEIHVNIKLSNI